jgi:hypothetical protein
MTLLGNGLHVAKHHEDALTVYEAQLSMERRLGAPEEIILVTQGNLAMTYQVLGRDEEAMRVKREVYSGYLRLYGEEHRRTLLAANNYAASLFDLRRFKEAKSVQRKMTPVARRVLGESHELTISMRQNFAMVLYKSTGATLDDLREAVATLEEIERTARRVMGGAHPLTVKIVSRARRPRSNAAVRVRRPSTCVRHRPGG